MRRIYLFFLCILGSTIFAQDKGEFIQGTASFYAESFHGQKTASGDIYDMNALTAAHKTLPFGTKLRVRNIMNGKTVVVTINDRGPYAEGRILDLSKRAAEELGFVEDGIAYVRAEILSSEESASLPNTTNRSTVPYKSTIGDPRDKNRELVPGEDVIQNAQSSSNASPVYENQNPQLFRNPNLKNLSIDYPSEDIGVPMTDTQNPTESANSKLGDTVTGMNESNLPATETAGDAEAQAISPAGAEDTTTSTNMPMDNLNDNTLENGTMSSETMSDESMESFNQNTIPSVNVQTLEENVYELKDLLADQNPVLAEEETSDTDNLEKQKVRFIYVIQLGAFALESNAKMYQQTLLEKGGIPTYIATVSVNNIPLYKVRYKYIFRNPDLVLSQMKEFQKMGMKDTFTVGKFFLPVEENEAPVSTEEEVAA